MGCKVGNHLEDDEYRVEVETHGSGAGIDRPEGVYPDLHMWWQPIYKPSCTFCAERMKEGEPQFCVMDCPTQALAFGDVVSTGRNAPEWLSETDVPVQSVSGRATLAFCC